MKSLLKSELDTLLAVAAKHSADDALLFTVIFNHGLRISEALSLTRENIVDGFLVIQRLKGSKKSTQALLPAEKSGLEKKAAKPGLFFLREYENRDSARVVAWRLIRKYGKEAGIPEFKLHPHVLKHTCGRLSYEAGLGIAEIQQVLGHTEAKNTLIYCQAEEQSSYRAFAAAVGK